MSNLEVLDLTEKSIRSGISDLFSQNLLGSIFMGQFCQKILKSYFRRLYSYSSSSKYAD